MVLGIEEGFTGERYIRHRMETDKQLKELSVFPTLKSACQQTIRMFLSKHMNRVRINEIFDKVHRQDDK